MHEELENQHRCLNNLKQHDTCTCMTYAGLHGPGLPRYLVITPRRSTRTSAAALPSYHPSQVYTDLGCRVSRIAAGTTEQRAALLLAQCGLN
eukprot:scaffold34510_cov52-Phaeocystis_antarctica.AAC.1